MNKLRFAMLWVLSVVVVLGTALLLQYQPIRWLPALGLVTSTLLLCRVLHLFPPRQVIPDRVRQALDTLAEGLLVLDEQHRIVLANRSFSQMVRLSKSQLLGQTADQLSWICSDASSPTDFPWRLAMKNSAPLMDQLLMFEKNLGCQQVFSVNCSPIFSSQGSMRGVLATFRDVTETEQHRSQLESMLQVLKSSRDEVCRKNEELEILASHDALTSCLNRRALLQQLDQNWHRPDPDYPLWACLMVDADWFKQINDTYGHAAGDEVLCLIAQTISDHLASQDLLCRYGGEEFCVMMRCLSSQHARRTAEQIRIAIQAIPMPYGRPDPLPDPLPDLLSDNHGVRGSAAPLRVTVSIGLACDTAQSTTPQALIDQADQALYQAKHKGRNCLEMAHH